MPNGSSMAELREEASDEELLRLNRGREWGQQLGLRQKTSVESGLHEKPINA